MKLSTLESKFLTDSVKIPAVVTRELDSPSLAICTCSWSDDTNIEDFFDDMVTKIELEFSEERTRVPNQMDPTFSNDVNIQLLVGGIGQFVSTYKLRSEDELIEFCVIMKSGNRLWYVGLGHFELLGLSGESYIPLVVSTNYTHSKLFVPGRGLGISQKSDLVVADFEVSSYAKWFVSKGYPQASKNQFRWLASIEF